MDDDPLTGGRTADDDPLTHGGPTDGDRPTAARATGDHMLAGGGTPDGDRPAAARTPGDDPLALAVVYDERYWYPDDGGALWLAGYQVVDPGSGRYLARDAPELAARRVHVAAVAGAARHHAEALTGDVGPGKPLELRRDRVNPHDAHAIAVHAPTGEQVGWVPRELAAEVAPAIDRGERWSAVVLRERRASPRDPRSGLTMLLAPATAIELRAT